MAEEDVIIIDDDDVIIIDDNIEDVIIIENDNHMDIDNLDESDEDSDIEVEPVADSDYESDSSDELMQIKRRNIDLPEIIGLEHTKICCISYYYVENESKYCTECFHRLSFLFLEASSVREHRCIYYEHLSNMSCKECRKSLHQILPCDMCPICTY